MLCVDKMDAVVRSGHNGRCDTLWTHLLMNGVQEVGGSNPLAPTRQLSFLSQQSTMVFCVPTMYFIL